MSLRLLHSDWKIIETPAGAFNHPKDLPQGEAFWKTAIVPGTVAQSLGTLISDQPKFDSKDYWYSCTFEASPSSHEQKLRFDGLATLADVWLNGNRILDARNMFVAHEKVVTTLLEKHNDLVIHFRALDTELSLKKARPRWKTSLISSQNLRWVRTTLLGRIPGWTPPIAPVGPWKAVSLLTVDSASLDDLQITADIRNGIPHFRTSAKAILATGKRLDSASVILSGKSYPLKISSHDIPVITGDFSVPGALLWWPHTQGTPSLHSCSIELKCGGETQTLVYPSVGFRNVSVDRTNGSVKLLVNGVSVFCRGACWTVTDFLSIVGTESQLREALVLAKNAGVNMLRIGGTMTYESDDFYRLCDELGILVWQDFMFANMDYPVNDPAFRQEIVREAKFQLKRLQKHACMAVYCGGSEVHQQAAMMGLPSTEWSNDFFDKTLPDLCAEIHPHVPYFASSPCEGALPFHLAEGVSHYYGVGAYKRPLSDVKSAGVKFTSECLGFSNVPESQAMDLVMDGALPPPHHPLWKARVPRDGGAGWDFEDIRDHYLHELFGIEPVSLRSADPERYYELSRVVTGEVMKSVFAEWRRPGSNCGGGLVWFFKDLWPGAGWGLIDSLNQPKAVYHYIKKAWAKQAVLMTDDGLDGLSLHALNETENSMSVVIGLEVFHLGRIRTASAEIKAEIPARGAKTFLADAMLGYFADLTYAYRFGAPKHDVVRATLKSTETGSLLSEDFYFPQGLNHLLQDGEPLKAKAEFTTEGKVALSLSSLCFLQNVHFSIRGYNADDSYFHLAPHQERTIIFTRNDHSGSPFKVDISALNLRESVTVRASQLD